MTGRMQPGPPPEQIDALRRGWHPVACSTEVGDEPVQVWLLGEPWALWRVDGQVVAHVDRCPHRLAPISAGHRCEDGTVQCGYHGWRFDGVGGACTLIPALGPGATIPPRARLTTAAAVAERAGLVWLAPEPPATPLIEVGPPEGAHVGLLQPARAEVDPGELIDNFLDVAHFPFVHAGTFGTEQSDVVDEYDLRVDEHGFTAVTEHEFANHEDPGVADGTRPLVQRRRLTYRYLPPFMATLRIDYLDAIGTNLIVFAAQPERAGWARVYTTLLRNDLPAEAMAHALEFEQRVLDEDLVVQRAMRVTLPLDLTAEVHTKADRLTIELRRSLARFIASHG
jgi:vanillate O-demethylase monooxygenase subunit